DVDGDPDLASGGEVWVWQNDGFPFSAPWAGTTIGTPGTDGRALRSTDLDADGDPDLVSGLDTGEVVAWANLRAPEGLGNWTETTQPSPVYSTLSVATADLDHDGRADIASGTDGKGIVAWWGDGGYTWTRLGEKDLPDTGSYADVDFGQINNRSELDLAAADRSAGLRAWVAWEHGTVWDDHSGGLPTMGRYEAVALGAMDHDGLLDLAAAGIGTGLSAWQGDSSGWNLKATADETGDYCDIAMGHINQDGHQDLVGANCDGGGLLVLLNDGSFGLDKGPYPAESGSYMAVALGDLDHDGDTDVVAAPIGGGVQVWLGDRGSGWTAATGTGAGLSVLSLDLSDFDNDGYLDILAGHEGGVSVWKGDGGATWTDASLGLPTLGTFPSVRFGRIDADAHFDIVAAEEGASGVRVWTATEPPPGGWAGFVPETNPPWVWNRDQTPTCAVQVADVGSGLDVSTAEYRFSRDGGLSWVGGWLPAACTGSDGTLDPQTISAADVPFNQDSADKNVVQFRILDMSGLTGTSPIYLVATDATPPTNPTSLASTSHTPGVWSGTALLSATWSDGIDETSGPLAYSYALTTSPTTLPDEVAETSGNTGSRSA
ncbi:MAG: FG-GAP repeat domain-containing protein, partial [Anaerolineae bacterium]